MSHYALLSQCQPLVLSDKNNIDKNKTTTITKTTCDIRNDLTNLYTTYAELYPNPRLVEEAKLRETLLHAASAASSAKASNQRRKGKGGGFFSFLFGSSDDTEQDGDQNENQENNANTKNLSPSDLLVYHDNENDNEGGGGNLCGTLNSLDIACIPNEAYSVARFHLASTRIHRQHPNLARPVKNDSSRLVIVGLGVIAELGQNNKTSKIQYTSDIQDLQQYIDSSESSSFELCYVRATCVGSDFLIVSWGFMDGILVCYRRMEFPDVEATWEALAMIGPTSAVLENMTGSDDIFAEDAGSALLRVSDVIPLLVESISGRPAVTIAISRLGGYIELVPLPLPLWYGPKLTPENHKRPPKPTKRRKRPPGEHYVAGKLRDVARDHGLIVALTTGEYHTDIICMESFRTSVGADTEWNTQAFPNGPPAEFILAATGASKESEAITFWAISTLFTDENEDKNPYGFTLHAALVEAISATTGSDVTIFADHAIMKRWRKPRQIELKQDATLHSSPMNNGSDNTTNQKSRFEHHRITTISTRTPIVAMHFTNCEIGEAAFYSPFLVLHDWNGSATIMDCSLMGKVATQNMSQEEYEAVTNPNDQVIVPLATTLVPRSLFMATLHKQTGSPATVTNLHWLNDDSSRQMGQFPSLALMIHKSPNLHILSFIPQQTEEGIASFKLLKIKFPGQTAAITTAEDGSLSFIVTKKKKTDPKSTTLLLLLSMGQLEPITLIRSLVQTSRFHEAITATRKLAPSDQELLQAELQICHQHIWREKRDTESLAEIMDPDFIVDEALALFKTQAEEDVIIINFKALQETLLLAIDVARRSQLAHDKIDELRGRLVKLGTYELLCSHMGAEMSMQRFMEDFFLLPVIDLAMHFARTADISALSIIWFRHRRKIIPVLQQILNEIPLSVNPNIFCHLVPLIRQGVIADLFIPSPTDTSTYHWSHLPQHLQQSTDLYVVLGTKDEKMVLDHNKYFAVSDIQNFKTTLIDWFVTRAGEMQQFAGNLQPVIEICELGMTCLEISRDHDDVAMASAAIVRLFKTWKSASSLQTMLIDGVVVLEEDEEEQVEGMGGTPFIGPTSATANTDDLLQMKLIDIVAMILHGATDRYEIQTRCSKYLQPLLMDITVNEFHQSEKELDLAVKGYSLGLVDDIAMEQGISVTELTSRAQKALECCVAIADASKTSIPKESRLVKEKKILIETVVTAITQTSECFCDLSLNPFQSRHLLDTLWDLYEALPLHVPKSHPSAESLVPLFQNIEDLQKDLVGVDLLSRWINCKAFNFLLDRRRVSQEFQLERFDVDSEFYKTGFQTIKQLCRSFVNTISNLDNGDEHRLLLHDLLSDIHQLNDVCYDGCLNLASEISSYLVSPLLQGGHFVLVAEILSVATPEMLDKNHVKDLIYLFVNDAIFSSDDGQKVGEAIKCQDIIGPQIPELQQRFLSIRRYLDASHFITNVLCDGDTSTFAATPDELRKMSPIDVVESVLKAIPKCIICRSLEWSDPAFAANANAVLRQHLDMSHVLLGEEPPSPTDLPALPSGAIFHLATILGLEDDSSALVVKCRVVHYGTHEGLTGAAAAICRTLVRHTDKDGPTDNDAVATAKLGAVASVVSDESYLDTKTKRELCTATLTRYKCKLSLQNSDAFNTILHASAMVEQRCSRFNPEFREPMSRRPIDRLYLGIQAQYNSNIHGLFTDLLIQTKDCMVHDSLMDALSRFVVYWSISDAIQPKPVLDASEIIDAKAVLALGSSLLLHIPNKTETAVKCVQELRSIIAEQVQNCATMDRFGTSDVPPPDRAIVQKLMDCGYSENGAVKSAVMTQNSSYNAALAWAIAHSSDFDFDRPLVVLKIQDRSFIDEAAIQLLQKCLYETEKILTSGSAKECFESIHTASGTDTNNKGDAKDKKTQPHLTDNRPSSSAQHVVSTPKDKQSRPTDKSSITSESNTATPVATKTRPKPQTIVQPIPKPKQKTAPPPPSPANVQQPAVVTKASTSEVTSKTPIQPNQGVIEVTQPSRPPRGTFAKKPTPPPVSASAPAPAPVSLPTPSQISRTALLAPPPPKPPPPKQQQLKPRPPPLPAKAPTEKPKIMSRGLNLKRDQAPATVGATNLTSSIKNPKSLSVATVTTTAPASAPMSLDRTSLREKGAAALNHMKGKQSPTDRNRLLAEGRLLFQKTRETSGVSPRTNPSPVAANPTAKIQGPLGIGGNLKGSVATSSSSMGNVKKIELNKGNTGSAVKMMKNNKDENDDNSDDSGWDFNDDWDV